jgi:hypothetical protein
MAIKLLTFSLILSLMLSCEKPENPALSPEGSSTLQMLNALTGDPPPIKNYIVLALTKRATLPQYTVEAANGASVMAAFYDGAGNKVSVGNIRAGDLTVSPAENNVYSYTSNMSNNTSSKLPSGGRVMDLAGQDVTVSADGGNGYSGFSQTVHVPADFNLNASAYNKYVGGTDLTLNWTPDPSNQFGQVLINVTPYPGTGTHVSGLGYLAADNGSFTIPATTMASFPFYSFITYSIARANEYEADPVNDIMIYTITEVSSDALQVVPSPYIYVRMEVADIFSYSDQYQTLENVLYRVGFYQNTACTVSLPLWSAITLNIHRTNYHWSDIDGSSQTTESDEYWPTTLNSTSYNYGWVTTYYHTYGEYGDRYWYSLPSVPNYIPVN